MSYNNHLHSQTTNPINSNNLDSHLVPTILNIAASTGGKNSLQFHDESTRYYTDESKEW